MAGVSDAEIGEPRVLIISRFTPAAIFDSEKPSTRLAHPTGCDGFAAYVTRLLSPAASRAPSPLPQVTPNFLVAPSPGGGWGRATDTERNHAAAVASTSAPLVRWLQQRNESTQVFLRCRRPCSLRIDSRPGANAAIGGSSGSLPLPLPVLRRAIWRPSTGGGTAACQWSKRSQINRQYLLVNTNFLTAQR